VLRIGVISDTHLPRFGRALPRALVDGLRAARVDLILHLGDWTSELAVDLLTAIAPTDGVAGNNDPPALVERFGTVKVVEADGVRLGLTHGHLGTGRTTPDRARCVFAEEAGLGAILFGHSHIPLISPPATTGGPWLLNPGSPTDKRRQPRYTWVLLTLDAGRVADAHLQAYDDRSP
jgi:putative phosphoesterase